MMSFFGSPLSFRVILELFFVAFACSFVSVYGDDILRFKPKIATDEPQSTLRFASYYANHMVLQKAPQKATVWGYASVDDVDSFIEVKVFSETDLSLVSTQRAIIKSESQGSGAVWAVKLKTMPPGGPYVVRATVGSEAIELKDVLFGDVWLCGGQSNMQFGVSQIFNASKEIANAGNYPHIRLFDAEMILSSVPLRDLKGVRLQWTLPSNHSGWTFFSAVCWLYGKHLYETLGYPIGLVESCWGGTPDEAWSSPDALKVCGLKQSEMTYKRPDMEIDLLFGTPTPPHNHTVLWNAMIHPLLNMTICGAIWYQGEQNAHRPDDYNCTFPAMISDWRKKFYFGSDFETSPVFPFGFVQLGPSVKAGSKMIRGFADIRWHQTADIGFVPNTWMENVFMATAVDDTDFTGGVHYRDKTTIGKRLALAGLSVAYGKKVGQFQGPFPSSYQINRKEATLTIIYDFNANKIQLRNSDGFEVCCSHDTVTTCPIDGNWTAAPVTDVGATSVQLSWRACGADTYVMGLRYLWRLTPCSYKKCAIYSVENELPAPPFVFRGFFGTNNYKNNRFWPTNTTNMKPTSVRNGAEVKDEPQSTIRFASYYADHMVLQKTPQRATVWGYASVDDVDSFIEVNVFSETDLSLVSTQRAIIKSASQSSGAVWAVKLKTMPPGGPYIVRATVGSETIELKDVLFGDVWLCGGQSNMQFGVSQILNASEEIANAKNYPHIRLFDAKMISSAVPLTDLKGVSLQWSLPSNRSLGQGWTYFSAVCWLYGKHLHETLGYPIGLVESCWGGTPIEAWSSPDALKVCGLKQSEMTASYQRQFMKMDPVFGMRPSDHSNLWNAMIHPLLNMTIYGAIWYQGEANGGKPDSYNCTFPAMISDWRKKFYFGSDFETSPVFPFGFVQIGPNGKDGSKMIRGFADIRWHQTADIGFVPNTWMENVFMATAVDDTDFNSPEGSIHPRDKKMIGKRLALAGLSVAYGKKMGQFQGPFPSSYEISHNPATLTIIYDFNANKIQQRNSDGFEVCCSHDTVTTCPVDGNWTAAPVSHVGATIVQLSWRACGADTYVMGLRYLWRLTPCNYKKCAIYSVENELPAPPFIFRGFFGTNNNNNNRFWHTITMNMKRT